MKTITEQLSEAIAQLEAASERLDALTAENAALARQLETANATITAKDAELAKLTKERDEAVATEKSVAKRAEARAIEIMAGIGQPAPCKANPNAGGESADKPKLFGIAAVEELYREKYGIK